MKTLKLITLLFGVFFYSCSNPDTEVNNPVDNTKQEEPPSKTPNPPSTDENTVETFSIEDNLIKVTQPKYTRNGIGFGTDAVSFDIDGDGEQELLVGASLSNIAGTNSGIIYVYKKDGDSFENQHSSLIYPPITNGYIYFASSLALGDINNDGKKDLLVGAPGDDSCGGSNRGAVYVYYYKTTGVDASPNLKICYPESNNNANFGYDVAVGDVDQDGKDDILVSANLSDTAGTDAGRAYLFMNDGDWSADTTFSISGSTHDNFGSFVAFIHSNSDDYLDVAVGVYAEDYGATNNGSVYIYNNDGTGAFANPSTPDLAIRPNYSGNYIYFGYSGAGLDINGDGREDLVVSIPGLDYGYGNRGTVLVYLGFKDDTGSNEEKTPDITINYPEDENPNYTYFGYWMGNLDFDSDGKDDLMLAINDSSASLNSLNLFFYSTATGDSFTKPAFELRNTNEDINPYTNFGRSVVVEDIDGDTVKDLIVGVPEEDEVYNGWNNVGLVLIYLGVSGKTFMKEPSYIIRPPYPVSDEYFGYALHTMDINGDGKNDLLVGAPQDELKGTNSGSVYIYYGGKNVFDTVADLIITDPGDASNNFFGSSIASGDLNGDTYPDLVIGAELDDAAGTDRGAVYVWRTDGEIVDPTLAPSQTITCSFSECSNYAHFGSSIAVADIDPTSSGTNYYDLLVGAELLDASGSNAGGVFVFKGTAGSQGNNPVPTSSYSLINDPSDNNSNYFGSAMTVADFDGDNIKDIAISADHEDSFLTDSGAVYFWYVKNDSFDISTELPNFRYYGITGISQNLGSSLYSVDINNDGKLDLVVGASGYDTPKEDAGILYIDLDFRNR